MMNDVPHPPWFDTGRPSRQDGVLPFMLERNASEKPDGECFRFAEGETWSNAEVLKKTRQFAAELAGHGVNRGDLVIAWMPNGPDIIRTWFALNYLGAVFVPLNLDYKGKILQHAIAETGARLMVAHPDLIGRLADIEHTQLELILTTGDYATGNPLALEVVQTGLVGNAEIDAPADVNLWDPQMVIFTSGTTGPSKGVLCPYLHQWKVGQGSYGYMTSDDVMLIDLPMFHVGGVSPVMAGITKQAVIVLYDGFSTTEFWKRIRKHGATTVSGIIGAMAAFLAKAPEEPGESDNSLRMVTCMLTEQVIEVAKRYQFSYASGFNMTELSTPLLTELDCAVAGSCGKPRTGCECRVVDEHDYECPPGVIGELVVRVDQPWEVSMGYLNQPGATAQVWRNGWFHTGDLVKQDEDGNFFFVDRLKDAVRRKGENISSLEVESEILSFPAVAEVAVVGVPSEHGEEEILAVVAAKPDGQIDTKELVEHLVPRMPHYMVPRYIRLVDQLPKTPTNKIQKYEIRAEGVTEDTWDREAAGITLKRTRLS
ncbi:MAG: ATP-dependent acyl-CoA ligase [Woeseia sp.]|nr:ATP-dependent acyl-CoA ligase [Woeseia sp.]|tara:strand:+ start:702 stop:2324 length:1623 start_codon:yes stop_codon:yes gene_type:complete